MRLSVDYERCQGHAQCASVAPHLFEIGPDDRAHLLISPGADVPEDEMGAAEDAIAMCPEAAVRWESVADS